MSSWSRSRVLCSSNQIQPQPPSLIQRFRQLSREYGRASAMVYVGMSATTFSIIYVSIWNGVDVERVLLSRIRHYKHILFPSTADAHKEAPPTETRSTKVSEPVDDEDEDSGKTEFESSSLSNSKVKNTWTWERAGTTFLVAFAANKLLAPLKLMLTVMVTPTLVKWIRFRRR